MRYIHDGKLRNRTVEPPKKLVPSEPVTAARGRTDTAALMASMLTKLRRVENPPLCIGHERNEWRWSK
ncbi:uncharacterized protein Nmag_0285 [Natrialba magadii ATCC 43099]|uniref:Uncharacterized protein n=1 Tax=Natrialba magadii (strain ATCC 43099 / DSM 3394 / CCM 3739 / CIP 104546 / IAM 13178 / JCM 8861 / NBRC 102185 / NCIMB 2190 / MS3) TaxID=547559 RepID=D3SX57_NATMM|nr:uncharacterized protein Nmag_0285 [Natrialba magadii ATCC 43099]